MEARAPTLADGSRIDIAGPEFALRLSNLLREHRRTSRERCSSIARRSGGRYRPRDLRAFERGQRPVDDPVGLTELYGADIVTILPLRTPIEIDPTGTVRAAGASEQFRAGDDEDMLAAYLRLVRRLRRAEREAVVQLRRGDVEILADVLHEPDDVVRERLGGLMAATRASRRMAVMALTGGVVVIGLGSIAVAATGGDRPAPDQVTGDQAAEAAEMVEVAEMSPVAPEVLRLPDGSWTPPVPPSLALDVSPLGVASVTVEDEPIVSDEEVAPGEDAALDEEAALDGDAAPGEGETVGVDEVVDEVEPGEPAPAPGPAPAPEPGEPAPAPGPAPAPEPGEPAPAPGPEPAPVPGPDPAPPGDDGWDDDEWDVGPPPIPSDDVPVVDAVEPIGPPIPGADD